MSLALTKVNALVAALFASMSEEERDAMNAAFHEVSLGADVRIHYKAIDISDVLLPRDLPDPSPPTGKG